LTTYSMTKSAFSEGVSEGIDNLRSLKLGETVEVGIGRETNVAKVALEPRPSANLLRIGSLDHSS
jgi:hypothetical protein